MARMNEPWSGLFIQSHVVLQPRSHVLPVGVVVGVLTPGREPCMIVFSMGHVTSSSEDRCQSQSFQTSSIKEYALNHVRILIMV